ncbi:reverse transcriptase [Teladorsagia circumcincta]|uniref:Reverse transcriptase n=1 Tax=Teladorsagia circumcincta TaxID=45464 RepID=A0A2G9UQ02_TELCI|nr:reverse transcriptase [Teladorsagia circumcincta]
MDEVPATLPTRRHCWGSICNVSSSTLNTLNSSLTTHLKKKFATVFTPGLGHCTKSKAKLVLKPNAKPVFQKARPVPYAAVQKISTGIDRLVSTQVLTPIDHSDWAAPIVAVQKKNGTIRLCADYSTGLNDALVQHQHPLPTPDDIFTKLNGGRYFSQLDLAEAYLQLEVDDDSKQLLTINTHQGLYRFNRLPFGVKPAPGIFQQCIDALIAGLHGTAAYLDDILVTGRTIDEHNTRLDAVFQRIQDYGFRVRLEKCSFLQTQIKYLGFVINAPKRRQPASSIPRTHQFLRKLRQGSAQSARSIRRPYEEGCCLHVDSGVPIFLRQDKGNTQLGSSSDSLRSESTDHCGSRCF